ncbi:MAG: efflux RND transporter periplasmic adaptor subunit, partial [Desulfobacterales bacterium]|nr:efflux RND transporter periplasmic adaptor subunit [Desulfobacterales bacterium]
MNDLNTGNFDKVEEPVPVPWRIRALRICIALVIVGLAFAGAAHLIKTAEKPKKRPPAKWVPVVQVVKMQRTAYQVVVTATGNVIPSRQIVLRSRVSGQVVSTHGEFSEGGILEKGDAAVTLDNADYRLALAQKKSDAVNSQYALKVELGRQEVAQREWQLLGNAALPGKPGTSLALRKPHLEKALADVESARTQVQKAQLDLERTRISAPFNALVITRSVDIGSQVSPQDPLAELVGTDSYWIRVAIPADRLDRITIPRANRQPGSPASIHYGRGQRRDGQVIRLLGDLEAEGRMARVLIEVRDPLRRNSRPPAGQPLLIGEYVRVDIQGDTLTNIFVIPRSALRDQETVWLLNPDMTLDIRKVIPVWRDKETVVIQNALHSGDR